MKAHGFLYCTGVTDANTGRRVALSDAVRHGWLRPGEVPAGFTLPAGAVPLGSNLWVDGGRQYAVYAIAARSPITDFTLQNFAVGTGTRASAVTDVALVNPVTFASGYTYKALDAVQFPAPFMLRAVYTIGAADCNGYLLTEFGLLAGDQTLMARVVRPGVQKTSDFAPCLSWDLRF